jgi:hypothetical protein
MMAFIGNDDVGQVGAKHQHPLLEQLMGDEDTAQESECHEPQSR